jgi:RNA polymerase-binding transcription factor DksA
MRFESARRALLQKRRSLLGRHAQVIQLENELYGDARAEPDLPDVAADHAAAAVLDKLSDAELYQLKKIGTALERIDSGTYGVCVVCGKKIVRARLNVLPEADRCTTCHNSH